MVNITRYYLETQVIIYQWVLILHERACKRQVVFGPASARSYKIGVVENNLLVDWLVRCLFGKPVFTEIALRIFLIFCMMLGDYNGRKVREPDFFKKLLIWRYSRKSLQISPTSDTLIFFSKKAPTIFLVLAWS